MIVISLGSNTILFLSALHALNKDPPMSIYNTILLAVDLHPDYDEHTTQKAAEFSASCGAKLHILHCVEPIHAYGASQGYQLILEVEKKAQDEATELLSNLSLKYQIPPEQQLVIIGAPSTSVVAQAKKINADLIIVGGHGRHGLSLLLGSTADGIIHHSACDVLAVRAKDK